MTTAVVGNRVDALVLAFRVALTKDVVVYLKQRHHEASKHGACSVRWGEIKGSMGFSRVHNAWHVQNGRYQLHLTEKGEGSDVSPEGVARVGWNVEIVWDAQELANFGSTKPAIEEATRIAGALGAVFDARLRRFDPAADISGFEIGSHHIENLVRRSRSKVDSFVQLSDNGREIRVHENTRHITGVTVSPGNSLMGRIYNKREELAVRGVTEKTLAEESRWRARGWDGEAPVTRVEFQIRGDAIKEFGLRNPYAPVNPRTGTVVADSLQDRVDEVWQRCLSWLRLIERTKERKAECPEHPVWLALRKVRFAVKDAVGAAMRFRVRRRASVEQTFGCALSVVGATLGLEEVRPWAAKYEDDPTKALEAYLGGIFTRTARVVALELTDKWKTAEAALEHVLTVHDAKRAFFEDAMQVTNPKHAHDLPGARRLIASSA